MLIFSKFFFKSMHTRLEKSDRIMRYSRYPLDPPLYNNDGPSFHVKIRLKTSCLIAHEPSLLKTRDKKSRDCCYGNWLLTYDLQVMFSVCVCVCVCANSGRILSNLLGTLKQFVNTLCCSNNLSTGSHALIPLRTSHV